MSSYKRLPGKSPVQIELEELPAGSVSSPLASPTAVSPFSPSFTPTVSLDPVLTPDPTNYTTLRHVTGQIPRVAYLICLIEFSERLSYYLIQGCITNMIQRKLPHNSTTGAVVDNSSTSNESPGALGYGLPLATFLMQMMTLVANLSPLFSGYYADTRLGRFRSIWIGTVVGVIGHSLLVLAAIPPVLKTPLLSLTLTVVSLLTVALSAGCIKPNLMPLLMDQYVAPADYIDTLPATGEKVLVDRKATLERMTLVYYLFVNIGCSLAFIGSFMERRYGFWFVFFITDIVYLTLLPLLRFLKPKLKLAPPSGRSVFDDIIPLLKQCFTAGWFQRMLHGDFWPPDSLGGGTVKMSDLRSTVQNCMIFLYFILFYVNDNALIPIQISQSGSMTTNGLPNDFFQSFNPIAILFMIPFQDYVLYPWLRRKHFPFTSVDKITVGFLITGIGSLSGAYIQQIIYSTNKCGYKASTCDTVSPISAWWGVIMYALQACGECFSVVTCYEMAYSRSAESMRSFVLALFLLSVSLSSVAGEVISYWAHDPFLTRIFGWCGGLCVGSAFVFYVHFYYLKKEELLAYY